MPSLGRLASTDTTVKRPVSLMTTSTRVTSAATSPSARTSTRTVTSCGLDDDDDVEAALPLLLTWTCTLSDDVLMLSPGC
jgi:hypothetical protein